MKRSQRLSEASQLQGACCLKALETGPDLMSPGLHPHQSASIALGFTFEKLSPNQSFSGSSAQMGHLPVSRNCRRWGLLLTGLRVMLGWLLVWVARVSITCHLSPLADEGLPGFLAHLPKSKSLTPP